MFPGARLDFLEAMLRWHLGNSTSTDLVLREVQDAIVVGEREGGEGVKGGGSRMQLRTTVLNTAVELIKI